MATITERIRELQDNEGGMTEVELFNAYYDIMCDEEFCVDDIDTICLFAYPVVEHEDRYGRVEYEEKIEAIKLNSFAKRTFTEAHQKALLRCIKDCIKDWSDACDERY